MPASLALLDLVPVLLTAAGLAIVVRIRASADPLVARWAALGAVLVVGGGAAKATWKLAVALGGPDVPVLYAALYPGLAVGYLLLLGATARVAPRPWLPALVALVPLVAVTVLVGPGGGRLVPLSWLVTGGLTSIALDIALARGALRAGRRGAALCLVVHAVATLGLQALGRPDDQSVSLQWVQETLNCVTQGVFLVGAATLARALGVSLRARALEAAPRTSGGA